MTLPDQQTIREMTQEVLSSRNYRLHRAEDAMAPFWARLIEALLWAFQKFKDFVDSIDVLPPFFRWLLVFVLLALLLLTVGHIVYSLIAAARPINLPQGNFYTHLRKSLDPEEYEQAAAELEKQGRYIESVRFLLRAGLLRIELAAKRTFRHSATNREYLSRYRNTKLLQPVQLLVDAIDQSWYGESPFEQDDFSRCQEAYQQIMRLLQRKSP